MLITFDNSYSVTHPTEKLNIQHVCGEVSSIKYTQVFQSAIPEICSEEKIEILVGSELYDLSKITNVKIHYPNESGMMTSMQISKDSFNGINVPVIKELYDKLEQLWMLTKSVKGN